MKPTLQLISIFVIALVYFIGYSMVPDSVADALHLKQIGQPSIAVAGEKSDDITAAVEDDNAPAEAVDTTKQRLLIIGDSMTQLLALRLSDYANKNGHTLTCVTWNGSGTKQWSETDTLVRYMRSVNPTHVFICLGSNELYSADLKNIRRRAEAIIQKVGKVPYTWVGPPNWAEDKGINTVLEQVAGKRHFFLSKGLKLPRQKDGRHPTYHGGVIWTDHLVSWLKSGKAAHPFALEKPEKRNAHYRQLFVGKTPKRSAHRADPLPAQAEEEPSLILDDNSATPATDAHTAKPKAETQHHATAEHTDGAKPNAKNPAKTDAAKTSAKTDAAKSAAKAEAPAKAPAADNAQ